MDGYKDDFEYPDADVRITRKWILKSRRGQVQTGLIWRTIRSSGRFLLNTAMNFPVNEKEENLFTA